MTRSRIAMRFFWALLALALQVLPGVVGLAHAQGTRKDDIVFNSRGTPLAGALIRVCAMPATGQPCTPLALIYSDSALTQALANPTTTDGLGNYFFYAAPGKYEIEISGPSITTKQIPNVILPNDPASPTFSGAISAFSLTLSGNLTVNGNTTVVGNLASGTLNLANQSTPPGSAGAGTVSLYTKTADKRLYYKDDAGTEIGPLGPGNGAQTNVSNTFTATQNIDADFHTKGPNPFFDLARYGGYTGSITPPSITCATTASSNTMTCSGGVSDFLVGHGVAIPLAGPVPAALAPGAAAGISQINVSSNVATVFTANNVSFSNGSNIVIAGSSDAAFNGTFAVVGTGGYNTFTFNVTHANCGPCTIGGSTTVVAQTPGAVTPQGILNGATTWNYKIVAADFNGGLSTASAAFTTTTGAATLGLNSATIAANGCTRSNGVLTYTTTAAHNFQSGVEINVVSGTTGDPGVEGAFTINSAPSSTTFTILQTGLRDATSCASGGTAQVIAKNLVKWVMQPGAVVMQSYIYRSQGAGAFSLVGITAGMDSSFTDWGQAAPHPPAYIPATPPGSSTNGILATTITAINGTQVTLATNAQASVASATVLHDNVKNVLNACTSAANNGQGGTIYFSGSNPQGSVYIFNAPLPMTSCPGQVKLQLGAGLFVNEPILGRNSLEVEGLSQGSANSFPSFVVGHVATIQGFAYPFFLLTPGQGNDVTFVNLYEQCNQAYQNCTVQDQDNLGNNVTTITYENVYMFGNVGSQPFKMGGGFGFHWRFGGFGVSGGAQWGFLPEFLDVIQQGFGASSQQLAGILSFDRTYIGGGEILFDAAGASPLAAGPGHMTFNETLNESGFYPSWRFNTGGNTVFWVTIKNASYADPLGGSATPLIDLTNAPGISQLKVENPGCANGFQPVFQGANQGGIEVTNGSNGCSILGVSTAILHFILGSSITESYINVPVQLSGANGQVFYQIALPAAPASAVVSAGGNVPIGVRKYTLSVVDANGNETPIGPSTSATTTSGNQTVTITPPVLPAGAVGWRAYRDGVLAALATCATALLPTATFVDTFSFTCGNSPPITDTASASGLGANGINTQQLKMVNNSVATIAPASLTANRTQTLPDATGIVPVSSYLNSAYDNATRANGAIGSNWTVQQNGLNIASNQIQGTGAGVNNTAFWNANAFSTVQFAQATVTALNGTTDFPGVVVLSSGTGTGTNAYDCIENTTNIFMQKIAGNTNTTLTSAASTGAPGDILRLEVAAGGVLTCSKNGVSTLTTTDSSYTSGSPGIMISGNVATLKNWSGGNLHPLGHLDVEQDWTKTQHFTQGVALGTEFFAASPRAEQNVFLPGALTATWTGATWTLDKAVTVTRVQVQAKTAPAGCTTNAIARLTDGTSPVNVTISAAANDSGPIAQNYVAGGSLTMAVQTAAAGCTTSPADANVVVQYRMQ